MGNFAHTPHPIEKAAKTNFMSRCCLVYRIFISRSLFFFASLTLLLLFGGLLSCSFFGFSSPINSLFSCVHKRGAKTDTTNEISFQYLRSSSSSERRRPSIIGNVLATLRCCAECAAAPSSNFGVAFLG